MSEVVFLGLKRLVFLEKTENFLETFGVKHNHIGKEYKIDQDGCELEILTEKMVRLAALNKERAELLADIREELNIP